MNSPVWVSWLLNVSVLKINHSFIFYTLKLPQLTTNKAREEFNYYLHIKTKLKSILKFKLINLHIRINYILFYFIFSKEYA